MGASRRRAGRLRLLVIVNDLDVVGIGLPPDGTDTPLIVDPDAVLSGPVPVSFSSRFPGDTRRSISDSAASIMRSFRSATRARVEDSLRDPFRWKSLSVSGSRKLRIMRGYNNAMRYARQDCCKASAPARHNTRGSRPAEGRGSSSKKVDTASRRTVNLTALAMQRAIRNVLPHHEDRVDPRPDLRHIR